MHSRGEKGDERSFRSMLEEDHISSSANFQPEIQWKPNKIFTTHGEESSLSQSGLISLDQPQFSSPNEDNSTITCHNLPVVYGGSPSSMLQSFLGPNNNQSQHQQAFFDQRGLEDYSYGTANYVMNSNESQFMTPQFVRNSSPKQQPLMSQNHLQFSNNAPYWNASSAARVVPDIRASFMPSLQPQFPSSNTNSSFEEIKPKVHTLINQNKVTGQII